MNHSSLKSRLIVSALSGSVDNMPSEYTQILAQVKPYTMTTPQRLVNVIKSIEYIILHSIPGAFVECGVWRGGCSMAAAVTLLVKGQTDIDLYLYDTFEGMSAPSVFDVEIATGIKAADYLATNLKDEHNHYWGYAPLETVRANMGGTGYPSEKIHLVKGTVEATIPNTLPSKIAVLRLDTDWYKSTMHELIHLYPLLSPGGVLIIDDYGSWAGSRLAIDEYFSSLPHPPELIPIADDFGSPARYCLKPGHSGLQIHIANELNSNGNPVTMSIDNPQSICAQGEKALICGQNHLAFKLYQEGVTAFPTYAELWRRLGTVALRCGDISTARNALLKANELLLQQQTACEMPFFKQCVPTTIIHDRSDLLRELCTGKKVLHVGCTDYPLFNPKTNLHIQLSQICSSLDGLDIDVAGLEELRKYCPGRYFADPLEVVDSYDLLLIPETIEHVDNISCFLKSLQHLRFNNCLITAPNAFQHNSYGNYWLENGDYVEHTHPDHNNWFSPYTLGNCIRKFTKWKVVKTFLLNDQQMVGCLCEKSAP